jgi:hypothetical protein
MLHRNISKKFTDVSGVPANSITRVMRNNPEDNHIFK